MKISLVTNKKHVEANERCWKSLLINGTYIGSPCEEERSYETASSMGYGAMTHYRPLSNATYVFMFYDLSIYVQSFLEKIIYDSSNKSFVLEEEVCFKAKRSGLITIHQNCLSHAAFVAKLTQDSDHRTTLTIKG